MWPDNETDRDFLNFSSVADTVAEIVVQAKGRPISIGVSGSWGIGKSSMIKLTKLALENKLKSEAQQEFIFVEFNAWLYQGYDDARAALMDVIASKLLDEATQRKTGTEKVQDFVKRVKWLRVAKLAVGTTAAFAFGVPPIGLIGEMFSLFQRVTSGVPVDGKILEAGSKAVAAIGTEASGLLNPVAESSPPKEIQALRDSLEKTLAELGVTLVVLIDDLDRCLPETTISTLEAIRLFLFLKNTAFVIAADDAMIRHAVKKHFGEIDDTLVTNYFDKLIQVPIRVPPLGTQEVRAYMMMLYVENSTELSPDVKEKIRVGICKQLQHTWQGKRVDQTFVKTLHDKFPDDLIGKFDTADRLAVLMTTASGILGNPRLIKRFLNALSIRMSIAKSQGVGVDEAVLTKLLLFERLGNPSAYAELLAAVNSSASGKPTMIAEWEKKALAGQEIELQDAWDDSFIKEWLTLHPQLGDVDLRGALYVSREHAPLITPQDRLSSQAVELLTALLTHPTMAMTQKESLKQISKMEIQVVMDKLLDQARQEQIWGVPDILNACLIVSEVDPTQGNRLAAFLSERPTTQIQPDIVPKIKDFDWAKGVFDKWDKSVSKVVKNAITAARVAAK
jgi:predicted KAP-like P-loop ATPase